MTAESLSRVFEELEAIRIEAASAITEKGRTELGQVFTPVELARELVGFFSTWGDHVRLLDPGAGAGTLSAVAALMACDSDVRPRSISVAAFELDAQMVLWAERSLELVAGHCRRQGVDFVFRVLEVDFLEYAADEYTGLFRGQDRSTHAILNPPYGKIQTGSTARKNAERLGAPVPNIYAAFMLGALEGLELEGELVAITPRSFCNGPYFKRFRAALLSSSAIRTLKVYESRRAAFADQAVLQENVVTHLERVHTGVAESLVRVESGDVGTTTVRRDVPASKVVFPTDPHAVIHILDTDRAVRAASFMEGLPCSLSDLRISASTGPVVGFRSREWLTSDPLPDAVPLIHPSMVSQGSVVWPGPPTKKPRWIRRVASTQPVLVKASTYLLVKRFTSKEERRRVVAGILDPADLSEHDAWGIENHLNYLHSNGDGLEPLVARGLAAFLNHWIVDDYFRSFSGHTQVNATDLRSLRYPSLDRLRSFGRSDDPASSCDVWVESRLSSLTHSDIDLVDPLQEVAV